MTTCKCGHETSERWCGKCGLKMPLGPGGRVLDRTECNLKQNREAAANITKALAASGVEAEHRTNLLGDSARVQSRIEHYAEEVAWLERMIAVATLMVGNNIAVDQLKLMLDAESEPTDGR